MASFNCQRGATSFVRCTPLPLIPPGTPAPLMAPSPSAAHRRYTVPRLTQELGWREHLNDGLDLAHLASQAFVLLLVLKYLPAQLGVKPL